MKIIFELLLVAFFLCGWEALFLLSNHCFPYVFPHFDHTDYSTISQFLNLTGQENGFRESNLYDEAFRGLIPYHYFELWLNAIIVKCSGLLYSSSLLLIVYPFFYFLFYLGVNAIWEEYGEVTLSKKLFSILFLSFGAFCFPFYEKLSFINQYFYGLVIKSFPVEFLAKKMICIYVFSIPAFLFMKRKHFSIGFLFLLCLPIVFAATAPGIIVGGFIFVVISYFLKLIPVDQLKRVVIYLAIFSVFIFLVFKVFGNHSFVTIEGNILDLVSSGNVEIKKQWSDIIWLAQSLPFQILIAYLPVIIILLFYPLQKFRTVIKNSRAIVLMITAIVLAGAATWAILLPVTDSFQFYSSLIPLFHIGCMFILIKLFSSKDFIQNSFKKAFTSSVLTGCLVLQIIFSFDEQWNRKREKSEVYSSAYLTEIEKLKNEIKNPIGACLYSKETPVLAPYRIQIGLYLKFIPGFENTVNISLLDREYLNPGELHHIKSSFFYLYVMREKEAGRFTSIEQSQLDFINKFNIDYIVAQKNALISELIYKKVKKIISDPKSGEKFILLDKNNSF